MSDADSDAARQTSPTIEFDLLGPGDYDRAKQILDKARHPGFVGRELFYRCATNGLACVARLDDADLGIALVTKGKLQALSVVQAAQGKGVGSALMARTGPKWVNAIMDKVPWFERIGYRCVGAPKIGQSGRMATQLLELPADKTIEVGAPKIGQSGSSPIPHAEKPKRDTVPLPDVAEFDPIASLAELLEGDTEDDSMLKRWRDTARPEQLCPRGDWSTWLILAGRGWGKTRTGAEWVKEEIESGRSRRMALLAATAADARDVMVGGESGILALYPDGGGPEYEPSKRRLTWPNGAIATTYTAEEPRRLRGPQHDSFWADEIAAWEKPQDAWDMMQLGLRLGARPRGVVTTTPLPIPLVRRLIADTSVIVTRGSTYDNAENLAPSFIEAIKRAYEGTRLGRQEIHAEVLDDNPGALWKTEQLEALRIRNVPQLARIVVGVDPAVSAHADSDETGIVVAGIGKCSCKGPEEFHGFVLDDQTAVYTPNEWAQKVAKVYHEHSADRVIAEVNNGGDLVESNLKTLGDHSLAVTTAHASRGKLTRAEPIAALYEQHKVHHVAGLSKLENQMTQWNPLADGKSPDRVDALVWALTDLMLDSDAYSIFDVLGGLAKAVR